MYLTFSPATMRLSVTVEAAEHSWLLAGPCHSLDATAAQKDLPRLAAAVREAAETIAIFSESQGPLHSATG